MLVIFFLQISKAAFCHNFSPLISYNLGDVVLSVGHSRRAGALLLPQHPRLPPPPPSRTSLGGVGSPQPLHDLCLSLCSPPGATHGVSDHDPFEDLTSPVMLPLPPSPPPSPSGAMDRGAPSSAVLVFSPNLWTLGGLVLRSDKGELKDDGVIKTCSPAQTLPTFPAHPFPCAGSSFQFL